MRKIIDFHAHLGDIFHSKNNILWDQNVQHGDYINPFMELEKSGFVNPLIGDSFEEFKILLNASDNLNAENTLQNLSKKLDDNNITYICIFPILPNNSFEEMLAASKFEPRILPFTSADYSLPLEKMVEKLKLDVQRGARGLKIHPVIQNIRLSDPKVHAAVETIASYNLPIISHCGANDYYVPEAPYARDPEAGDVKYFIELAQKYPDVTLVAGHAGGLMGGEIELLTEKTKGLKNLYVDTTFRSAQDILRAVEFFGRERVLYGTDNPFATHVGTMLQVENACKNDAQLADLIFFENAARILHIYR
ncbi:MAG: amidohydrolase family protein [Bacillota bacterium]|jgi:predicted TIM-barrel fold metal-dependent hydrolase